MHNKDMKRTFNQYLLEPLDLVLQLHLPGPGVEVCQPWRRAAAAARPLCLQLEELQMLQFSTQVLYQLHRDRTDEYYIRPMQYFVSVGVWAVHDAVWEREEWRGEQSEQ